jgi:hypothetical protein
VAALLLAWQWPQLTPEPEGATANETPPDNADTTADVVGVRAERSSARTLRVTLDIADGWHVNANPASMDFLIPTTIQALVAGEPLPLSVTYPPGRKIETSLDETWAVYDDGMQLFATVADGLPPAPITVTARVQACHDQGRCLTPDTLRTTVGHEASP